eukprot:766508-Hanusia_phi.AAC.2
MPYQTITTEIEREGNGTNDIYMIASRDVRCRLSKLQEDGLDGVRRHVEPALVRAVPREPV